MAIGNIGYDLGQRNDKELLTIRYSATSESQITANNRLVCTGRKNVTVTGNGSFNLSAGKTLCQIANSLYRRRKRCRTFDRTKYTINLRSVELSLFQFQ